MHWREVFPDFGPHIALRGARKREGLTQDQLAQKLGEGVTQSNVSEMEAGKRPIGKAMAKKLGRALEMNWRIFLQRPKWNGERLWYLHGVTRLRNGSPRGEL